VDLPGGGRGIGEDGIGAVDLLIKGDQKWNWWWWIWGNGIGDGMEFQGEE
jgi:hypothetical protein